MRSNNARRAGLALAIALSLGLAACAPRTVVTTNRALDYNDHPRRIYVMAAAGMGWGNEFSAAFRAKFREVARNCGTATTFEEVTGLELDKRPPVERAEASGADAVLTITQGGGMIDVSGHRLSIGYDATLNDLAQRRPVWRAKLDFRRGGTAISLAERGTVLAIDMTNGLKSDGVFAGCAQVAVGRNGRLDPAMIAKDRADDPATAPRRTADASPRKQTLKDLQDLLPPP